MIIYIILSVITIGLGGFVFGSGVLMQYDNSWSTEDGYYIMRGWDIHVWYRLVVGAITIIQGILLMLASQC